MKNFRRSRKALSPVVASIILIAVTVAVSIAVAAWMGALTVGFMGSNSVTVTNVNFVAGSPNVIDVSLKNTGTKALTIAQVKVNNVNAAVNATAPGLSLDPAATGALRITSTPAWTAGNPYKMDLYDTSGQVVASYQANAPGS